jgi:hypothetical protein
VRFAKVWVTEAYDAADGPNNLVAISEIELSTKH